MNVKIFYLAKYALTDGEVLAVEVPLGVPLGVKDTLDGWLLPKGYGLHMKLGRDIFKTREAAVARANELCDKKIASLQKQIRKLEGMEFK